MKRKDIEITDELLACYLEGKLSDVEKAAVEQFLSEHEDAMDTVILVRYEMGYKRMKRRFYVIGLVALVILASLIWLVWRLVTPVQMKVNIVEDSLCSAPTLPFESGTLQCEYAGNALQIIPVGADNRTVFLNDIPYHLKNRSVHLIFTAEGYHRIDTTVKAQSSVELRIKRNNDLGVVFGRVSDFESGKPIEGAAVNLLEYSVITDSSGQFRIEIPFDKQDKAQRVLITKEGYHSWDELYRPSATEPWLISLEKEVRP